MGRFSDKIKQSMQENEGKFIPLELNDGNVKAIFNRCLAEKGSIRKNCSSSILFSRAGGYSEGSEQQIFFNTKKLLSDEQEILYIFGQLKRAHEPSPDFRLTIDDAFITYSGRQWTSDNTVLLEFLYLGAAHGVHYIAPFTKKLNSAVFNTDIIKPTLSPKDPNFPAWWEEHKSEWETEQ